MIIFVSMFKFDRILLNNNLIYLNNFIFNYDKNNYKEIIVASKFIDITKLNEDFILELNVELKDAYNNVLKKIIIVSKYGIYYLFLREFNQNIYLLYAKIRNLFNCC